MRIYQNLEQRMIHTYLDTFPPFTPSSDGPSTESQSQFYQFMDKLYRLLAETPGLLFRELHADDAHTNRFNKGQDQKPKLVITMRKVLKEVESLLAGMFALGQAGRVIGNALVLEDPPRMGKKHRRVFEQVGLRMTEEEAGRVSLTCEGFDELFPAWVWMAARPGTSLLGFSRCLFREGHPYASEVYARLSGDEAAFQRLERYLVDHGYARLDNREGGIALDYVKGHGDAEPPRGGWVYGVRHTGISARYDVLVKEPPVFGLCIPRMREVLAAFDKMDESLQGFVVARTKQCDGCRYCVQTDKTGKRPLARIPVRHGGKEVHLCPLFPGYGFCWNALDDDLVDRMIGMLGFMDGLFDGGAPGVSA